MESDPNTSPPQPAMFQTIAQVDQVFNLSAQLRQELYRRAAETGFDDFAAIEHQVIVEERGMGGHAVTESLLKLPNDLFLACGLMLGEVSMNGCRFIVADPEAMRVAFVLAARLSRVQLIARGQYACVSIRPGAPVVAPTSVNMEAA